MPSLKQIALKNNLQMQEWVKQKIDASESQIKLWTLRLNDKSYFTSMSYINFQLGKYTLDKEYFNHFKYLLEVDYNKISKEHDDEFKQIKI